MKKKILIFAISMIVAPYSAQAALIDVTFEGKFDSGEALSGKLTYDAVQNKSGENFVEFDGIIKEFEVASSLFLSTNGVDRISEISSGLNRIRYVSGVNTTVNAIQFMQDYSKTPDTSGYGYLPTMFLGAGVPVGTFSSDKLPDAFSFSADDNHRMNFYYSYNNPNGGYNLYNYATISSMKASPAVGVTSAVPEPATWAMMIGGFGVMGATLRRRRRIAAFA